MKKRTKIIVIILAAALVLGGLSLYYLRYSRSTLAVGFRGWAKSILVNVGAPDKEQALSEAKKALPKGWRLVDDDIVGFTLGLPKDAERIDGATPGIAVFEGDGYRVTVTREWSVEGNVPDYVSHYYNRFILDEGYQAENGLTLISHDVEPGHDLVVLRIDDYDGLDTYAYANFFSSTQIFHRVMVKYDSDSRAAEHMTQAILNTFRSYRGENIQPSQTVYNPVANPSWNDETRALYDRICATGSTLWGIFVNKGATEGLDVTIPAMEDVIGYDFEVVLGYAHSSYCGEIMEFPTEFMEKAYANGKIIELTYQLTDHNNEKLFAASPMLDLYKTGDNEAIREFARGAAEFGHPFLFRLNNEMNSDWTNYSGVVNLQDPDIYIETWRTIFRIFDEEGATNAIWIWNPHDRSFPPAEWTHYLAYYPGNEYVHMLGVTGYNNGTYYAKQHNEKWREFDEIYTAIEEEMGTNFAEFPWIITEFASSSIGGDKAKWIDGMFNSIEKHGNIKIAVWFSSADHDENGAVARPYWLDETQETLEAFARGRARQG